MVLALILDWNGLAFTRDCVAALRRQTAAGLKTLVVDNGSTAYAHEALREACPGAEVVRAPSNLGFAGGVAWGLAHGKAAAEPWSHLWLLNNYTLPAPDALEKMLAAFRGGKDTAAVGCPLEAPPDRPGANVACAMRLAGPLWIPRPGEPPDYLCGASILMSREALDAIGPLDSAFPFFFEDADWCFRARRAGWRIAVARDARVVHLGSATIGRMGAHRSALYREGWVRFLRKYAKHPFASSVPATAWRVCANLAKLRFADALGDIRGFLRGWSRSAGSASHLPK